MKNFFHLRSKLLLPGIGLFLGLLLIAGNAILLYSSRSAWLPDESDRTSEFPQETELQKDPFQSVMTVEIQGAVIHPGVYQVPVDTRVVSLVHEAGGFSREADPVWIRQEFNQAKVLQDGDKIYIKVQGEAKSTQPTPTKKPAAKKKTTSK
jgi:competence protein ComEA